MDEVYSNAPCGYLSMRPDGTILVVNERFAAMIGRRVEEVAEGTRLHDLLSIGSHMYFETHVHPLLHMQGFVDQIALDFRSAAGHVPALVNAVVRFDDAGDPLRIDAIVVDATERRRYEREIVGARNQAEEAARIKGELLSMVSHDMRSSVAAIATVAELFERSELSGPQGNYLRILKSSTNNLLLLINDVLDYGRLEGGHMHLEIKPFDLAKLVHGIAEEMHIEAQRKNLRIETSIDAALPSLLVGDRIKLGRVLGNLVGNAIKFTDQGTVQLRLRLLGTEGQKATVEIAVSDTGVGIPADQMESIFEDFRQGSNDVGRRYAGSGLGLGICNRLLALHGSTLQVESQPGRGARFSFELKLDIAPLPVDST